MLGIEISAEYPKSAVVHMPRHVESPRQVVGVEAGLRLHQRESLNRLLDLYGMLPNALAAYTEDREIVRVETAEDGQSLIRGGERIVFDSAHRDLEGRLILDTFNDVAANTLRGLYTIPVNPWGDLDIIHIDLGAEAPLSMVDLPEEISKMTFRHQARILEYMQRFGDPVYWGVNNSAGTLDGKGLMSVLYPHAHMSRFGLEMRDHSATEIRQTRAEAVWDDGISQRAGERIANDLNRFVLPQYKKGEAIADPMGFTITIPGFGPADLGNPDFINKFWRPLSHLMHGEMRAIHQQYFASDLDRIIRFVQAGHYTGINEEEYAALFAKLDPLPGTPDSKKMAELDKDGLLRRPVGWAGGIQFNGNDACVAGTIGVTNVGFGPIEGFGIELSRPNVPLSVDEMRDKTREYKEIMDYALQ